MSLRHLLVLKVGLLLLGHPAGNNRGDHKQDRPRADEDFLRQDLITRAVGRILVGHRSLFEPFPGQLLMVTRGADPSVSARLRQSP